MRQQKQVRNCPECGGPLKKIIGAKSRRKYWECVQGGVKCHRSPVRADG